MKPLATHERVLTWLCICPAEDGTSKWMISLYIIFISIAFVFEVSILVSSYVYFLKNMSDNLEEALYALAQISGFGNGFLWKDSFFQISLANSFFNQISSVIRWFNLHKFRVILFASRNCDISWNFSTYSYNK